jgi:predicted N-acetyltransferase YhbS
MNVGPRLEEVHNVLAKEAHWYLMVLGVDPAKQGSGIGGSLIEPVIARADAAGVFCYLETFTASNLRFYKRRGFRIAAGGNIPNGGPDFWAMIRHPHAAGLRIDE